MAHGPRAHGKPALFVQHPLHIGMMMQLCGRAIGSAALCPLGGIGGGNIGSAAGVGDPLQRHINTGVVHQGEHGRKPLAFRADQLCASTVKAQLAGRRGVQTHFVFNPCDTDLCLCGAEIERKALHA